jgi:hypothetical protein
VSLVFDRKVSRRTPGQFRTRVITDGVVPSLHVARAIEQRTRVHVAYGRFKKGRSAQPVFILNILSYAWSSDPHGKARRGHRARWTGRH